MSIKTVTAFITKRDGELYGFAVSLNEGQYLHHVREEGEPTEAAGILETLAGIPLPHEFIIMLAEQDEDELKARHGSGLTLEEIGTFEAEVDDE